MSKRGPGKGNRTTHHSPKQLAARRLYAPFIIPKRAIPTPDPVFQKLPASEAGRLMNMRRRRIKA